MVNSTKTFWPKSYSLMLLYRNKLECLILPFIITLVKYLKARLTRVEPLMGLHSNGWFLALLENIRLG